MSKKGTLLLILALICLAGLWAGGDEGFVKNYLLSYPLSAQQAVTEPLRWEGAYWIAAGGVVLAAGSLYWADPEIRSLVQEGRRDWIDAGLSGVGYLGEYKLLYPAVGVTVAAGCLTGSEPTVDTGLLCLKSMVLTSAAVQALKLATQRQRPDADHGSAFWAGEGFSWSNNAFPSGHSALLWSIAPILADQYSDSGWVAPLVYGLAVLSSYSRLQADEHWASDVFAGAVLGYLSARITLTGTPRLAVSTSPKLNGISFSLDF